jgi:hypothetical protein
MTGTTRFLPTLPAPDFEARGAEPAATLADVADTHARLLWGEDVARGEPVPVSDAHGNVTAYVYPFALGTRTFPGLQHVFETLREARANDPDRGAAASALGRFGSVTVSATRTDVPVLGASHFLPQWFTALDEVVEVAEQAAGEHQEVTGVVVLNPHEQYVELTGETQRTLVRATTLDVVDDDTLRRADDDNRALVPPRTGETDAAWAAATQMFPEGVEAADVGQTHTVKTVPLLALVPVIPWTWWCVPTANSMVLGFWDNVVKGQPAILGYGRLVSHWFEHTHNKNCHDAVTKWWKTCDKPNAVHNNVPSILDEMIDPATGTWRAGYKDQPDWIKKRFGYTFSRTDHSAGEGAEALWQVLVAEINAGRPLVWTVPGHSVTAVGYRSGPTGKFAIVYNTYGTHAEIGKIGSQYEEIAYTKCAGLGCIQPGGGDGGNNLAMVGPDGGEVLTVGTPATITWHLWGTTIATVTVERSVDGGNTWAPVATDVPASPGFGQHTWVPDKATAKLRIRVHGTSTPGTYIAGDGSERNITVKAKPATGWGTWRSLGKPGVDLSTLATARNADGRVELFATAANGELRHAYQAQPNTNRWIAWGSLGRPAGGFVRTVETVGHADGRLAVLCVGADQACWSRAQSSPSAGPWTPWASLGKPPSANLSRVTAVANADGRIDLFGLASDGALWHAWQNQPNQSSWSPWVSLGKPPGGFRAMTVSVGRNLDGRLEAFLGCVIPDETEFGVSKSGVWHLWQTEPGATTQWSPWTDTGQVAAKPSHLAPVVGANTDGRLEVFATAGGDLKHGWQPAPNHSTWSGWATLARPASTVFLGSLTAVARSAQGHIGVVVSGFAGMGPSTISHCWLRQQSAPNNGWAGWVGLDTPPHRSVMAMAMGAQADGRRILATITAEDRALWYLAEE